MANLVSVIIPNRNGEATIGRCLNAALDSDHGNFEVIVIDDCSEDGSVGVIGEFPCTLIRREWHGGAAAARNAGALNAKGNILFFTDADCLLERNALSLASRDISSFGPDVIVGGTYTLEPDDDDFFSRFQSIFINYSETKKSENPDYVATHAMAIDAEAFRRSSGFSDDLMTVAEDIEFCHRMRRAGFRLVMDPAIQVRHIFNFSLWRSLCNAAGKAMHWTAYSIWNRDLFKDSGTASVELKVNVVAHFLALGLVCSWPLFANPLFLVPVPPIIAANLLVSGRLLRAFHDAAGMGFAITAGLYYVLIFPLAVGSGTLAGAVRFLGAGTPAWKGR